MSVVAATAGLAGPEQEVIAATADLFRQENYSWTRALKDSSRRMPEVSGRPERPAPELIPDTFGRTENGGVTEWHSKLGPNSDRLVRGVNQGDRCLIDAGDGWMTLAEFERRRRIEARPTAMPDSPLEGIQSREERLFKVQAYFLACRGRLTPAAMLQAIEGEMRDFSRGAGAIWTNLTEDGAQRVMELVKTSNLASGHGVTARATAGAVKLWVEDGHLVKLEVQIEGRTAAATSRKTPQVELKQIYLFTFDQFGTSDPRLTSEALEKLQAVEGETARYN